MRDKKRFIVSPKYKDIPLATKELVTIIILGEDHGHRMKSHGPLSLINFGEKTIIEKQVETIKSCFTNFEIILCSGFEVTKVANFIKSKFSNINIRIVENQMHYHSNCCESARLCLNNTMNNRIILFDGSIIINNNHLQKVNLDTSCILIQNSPYNSNFEVGVIHNDNLLENMSIGLKSKYWSEILYLYGHKDINHFSNIISNPDFKNKFMFEAINEMNKKSKLLVVENSDLSIKIDNIKTLKGMLK